MNRKKLNSLLFIFVSTIISLRTKDAVTMEASRRLFQAAPDIDTLASMDAGRIAEIIKHKDGNGKASD